MSQMTHYYTKCPSAKPTNQRALDLSVNLRVGRTWALAKRRQINTGKDRDNRFGRRMISD